jgi:hypothetical protein
MIVSNTYYLPYYRKVFGSLKDDLNIQLILVATYFKFMPENIGRYDGVSIFSDEYGNVKAMIICLGCHGKGFGIVREVINGELVVPI